MYITSPKLLPVGRVLFFKKKQSHSNVTPQTNGFAIAELRGSIFGYNEIARVIAFFFKDLPICQEQNPQLYCHNPVIF
jgi:hypothetical protein